MYYLTQKKSGNTHAKRIIAAFLNVFAVTAAAQSAGCGYVVTRHPKGSSPLNGPPNAES